MDGISGQTSAKKGQCPIIVCAYTRAHRQITVNTNYLRHLPVQTIDISYTLDGASHTVGRRKMKPDRRCWSYKFKYKSLCCRDIFPEKNDKTQQKPIIWTAKLLNTNYCLCDVFWHSVLPWGILYILTNCISIFRSPLFLAVAAKALSTNSANANATNKCQL